MAPTDVGGYEGVAVDPSSRQFSVVSEISPRPIQSLRSMAPEVKTTRLNSLRSTFSHYLPRLRREFYQGDAVVFWTLSIEHRARGWLDGTFHRIFRETMLHASAREGLICPAYSLMPDHIHLVWMGLRRDTDQRNGMKFFRAELGPHLGPAAFQHQAHDHVLKPEERRRSRFSLACTDYVLLNAYRARLVNEPNQWPYLGAVIPGYPRADPFEAGFWNLLWKRYAEAREPGLERRVLPPREME